jgi:hypothetical protein
VIANASIGYSQRGFLEPLTGNTWAALLGGNTVNGSSLSRANAVRYDTPTVGGFSVAAAWGENDLWDVALRYAGEFSGFRVAAGIGYADNVGGTGDALEDNSLGVTGFTGAQISQVKGSASILHVASGLYLTSAYLTQDNDTAGVPDTTLWYIQGGISQNWTSLGKTTLYAEYTRINDALQGDADTTMYGFGVVQTVDAAALDLFLAYRNFSADVVYEDTEDFSMVVGGARIRF